MIANLPAATTEPLQRRWEPIPVRPHTQSGAKAHHPGMDRSRTRAPASRPPSGGSGYARPFDAGRTQRVLAAERRIGAVAHMLDNLIRVPGTGQRVGIDPLIGFIPVIGDLTSAIMAAWIVLEAARFNVPPIVLARMTVYAAADFLIGLIPLIGDLFDLGFKANMRNVELFHRHAVDPGASTSGSWALVGGIVLAFAGIIWLGFELLGRFLSIVVG